MKLVKWQLKNLAVPMVDINGNLYCTSKMLCLALGVTLKHLKNAYSYNKAEIGEPLGAKNQTLRSFLKTHKDDFEIKRVRQDLNLWSEKQMLTFSCHIKSDQCIGFRSEMIDLVISHAKISSVSRQEYEALKNELDVIKEQLTYFIQQQEPLKKIASGAGKLLYMQRHTKKIRKAEAV